VLGFAVRFTDEEVGWTRVGLSVGDTLLELFSPRSATAIGNTVDPFYPKDLGRPKIALTITDVEGTYDRLVAADIPPLCPITSTPVSRFFFITDPDGTPIQLHEFSGGRQRVTELFA
jgi:predicted enzyme related to lactoylglutathione lyase